MDSMLSEGERIVVTASLKTFVPDVLGDEERAGARRSSGPTLVVIPARLGAERLPHKPLLDIGGKPMIVRTWERAVKADVGPVVVACAEQAIADAIESVGGMAVLTDPSLRTGSDRVHQAAEIFDPQGRFQVIVNVQGDLPLLDPSLVAAAVAPLNGPEAFDLSTVASALTEGEKERPGFVKIALTRASPDHPYGRALYFSRAPIPYGTSGGWHHIGIYAYRRPVLSAFVALPQSPLELCEKLEQLRALEAGYRIGVQLVDVEAPFGVDTLEDLERARACIQRGLG